MVKEKGYEIVITTPARISYQETVLPYLLEHFSIKRAAEIDRIIAQKVASLSMNPFLGTKEKYLEHLENEFRFLLHRESRNFEIKIIYFASEKSKTIYITDFFPTTMNPSRLAGI